MPRFLTVAARNDGWSEAHLKPAFGAPGKSLPMRFRHLVMAGFKELGIPVDKADLLAERRNVLAELPARL